MANPTGQSISLSDIVRDGAAAEATFASKTTPEGRKYAADLEQQRRFELAIVQDLQMCTSGVKAEDVAVRLSGIKPDDVKAALRNRFYNGEALQAAACVVQSLHTVPGEDALAPNERIREYVTKVKQIGSESVSGYAMTASLKAPSEGKVADGIFILKAPRNPKDRDELLHEAMVAGYGTNALRKGIDAVPNFAWVYGISYCSPPVIDPANKQVVTWCNSVADGVVGWAWYENIYDAVSFGEFATTASAQDILRYYICMMLGTRTAFRRCGFTHYDFHDENVLLCRRLNGKFYVRYRTAGPPQTRSSTVRTSCGEASFTDPNTPKDQPLQEGEAWEYIELDGLVPTAIDYGMSHIQLRDERGELLHFGHASQSGPLVRFGVYRDRCNPLHDAFKLFCMMMYRIRTKNPTTYRQLLPFLRFFDLEDLPETIIVRGRETFYGLPYNRVVANLPLDAWIDYLREHAPDIGMADPIVAAPPPGAVVLQCGGDCFTFSQELQAMGVDVKEGLPTPGTFLEFYDAYGAVASNARSARERGAAGLTTSFETMANNLATRFRERFPEAFSNEQKRLDGLLPDLKQFTLFRMPRNVQDIFTPTVSKQLRTNFVHMEKFLDAYGRLALGLRAIRYIERIYQVPSEHELKQLSDRYQMELDKAKPMKDAITQTLMEDVTILQQIPDIQAQVNTDDRLAEFRWYFSSYPAALNQARNLP